MVREVLAPEVQAVPEVRVVLAALEDRAFRECREVRSVPEAQEVPDPAVRGAEVPSVLEGLVDRVGVIPPHPSRSRPARDADVSAVTSG